MWTALIVISALAATPPAILVVPSTPSSRPVCEELLEVFAGNTVRVKLAGEKADAVTCAAKKKPAERTACLVEALTQARVDAIVLVTASFKAGRGTVTFQLLARNGESERQEVVRGPRAKVVTLSKPAISRTLGTLRAMLLIEEMHAIDSRTERPEPAPPPAPQEPRDTPTTLQVNLQPVERPPTASETVRASLEPPRKNRAAAIAVTGVAVAGAGVGAAFAGLGFSNRARLASTTGGVSALRYSQAGALKDQANLQLTVALGAGIAAAVAGTIAGVLWAQ